MRMTAAPDRCSWRAWQKALNAQPIPQPLPRLHDPIPVRARLVWEVDGETWLDGNAIRWTASVVLVRLNDRRCSAIGEWLVPGDMRRADLEPSSGAAARCSERKVRTG